jgi:hypothetical protein
MKPMPDAKSPRRIPRFSYSGLAGHSAPVFQKLQNPVGAEAAVPAAYDMFESGQAGRSLAEADRE